MLQLFSIHVSRTLHNIAPIEPRLAKDSFIFSVSLTFTILYPVTYLLPSKLYVSSKLHFTYLIFGTRFVLVFTPIFAALHTI